ncbi:TonB family protein [Fluviicola taffensis DSM 16823]|uniref:TonB family protein n=2 Tax=Fluviicola TaxID=332102 RepID=F2IAG5_FLUTR|nr:TonB family protein [Fluviicola taffensis DSM 16823]
MNGVAFGQSAKKVNKQLRNQLIIERHKQDSAYAIFVKDKTHLENLRKSINKKISGQLLGEEHNANRIAYAFENTSEELKILGIDPDKLVSDSLIPVSPYVTTREFLRLKGYALNAFVSFDMEGRDGSDFDQYKIKEQNLRLNELVTSYQYKFTTHLSNYRVQRKFIVELETFEPSIDRLLVLYKELIVRLNKENQVLIDKLNELETNYIKNGPKNFPDVYKQIFPYAHLEPVKVSEPIELKLVEEDILLPPDDLVNVVTDEPITDHNSYRRYNQEPVIYDIVEDPASFPGGLEKLKIYLLDQIVYPSKVKEEGITGKVYLRFVVSDEGEISNVKVLRGVSNCSECDKEALRVLKKMPNWIPAKIGGKYVHSHFNLPITFKL